MYLRGMLADFFISLLEYFINILLPHRGSFVTLQKPLPSHWHVASSKLIYRSYMYQGARERSESKYLSNVEKA